MKSSFTEQVYLLTKKIPKGKVTTYKLIAESLGSKAYRAVGNALNKNKNRNVPCHRVINSNGKLGGFARGIKEKIRLLKNECIEIKNNKGTNLEKRIFKFNGHWTAK